MAMELLSILKRPDDVGDLPFIKLENEDFRYGSRLIVGPDDTAVFYKKGVLLQSFTNGDYKLETNNFPFFDKIGSFFTAGVKACNCKVFFIRNKPFPNQKWGTPDPIPGFYTFSHPITGERGTARLYIQARGNYTVRIENPQLFVTECAGTSESFKTIDDVNDSYLFPRLIEGITDELAAAVSSEENAIFNLQAKKRKISDVLESTLNDRFAKFGMRLEEFFIEALNVRDDENWQKLSASLTDNEVFEQSKAGRAKVAREKMELNGLGENWARVQARDIMMGMANNQGAGGAAASAGAGIGMGMAAGGVMGAMAGAMFQPFMPQQPQQPQMPTQPQTSRFAPKAATPPPAPASGQVECPNPNCRAMCPAGGKFCGECGTPLAPAKAICPNCGHELTPGAKFCGNCGVRQS